MSAPARSPDVRERAEKLLSANGEAGYVECHPDGSAEYQHFVAQAGPFDPGTRVVVLGQKEVDAVLALLGHPEGQTEPVALSIDSDGNLRAVADGETEVLSMHGFPDYVVDALRKRLRAAPSTEGQDGPDCDHEWEFVGSPVNSEGTNGVCRKCKARHYDEPSEASALREGHGYIVMSHYRRDDGTWWWSPRGWYQSKDKAENWRDKMGAYRTETGAEVTHHVLALRALATEPTS